MSGAGSHSSPVKGEEVRARYRRFVPVFLILILILGLIILPSARAETIKIGLPSVTITAMPFFVAKEHGFFQQEGLNAELVVMPASLNIKVLLAGEIQYAATIGSAVAAAIRGINVRSVMLFVDRPLQDLVGAPGINTIADLKSKVLALSSRGGLQDIIMQRILTQAKIDHSQVTTITIAGQTALITALKTGSVAAALINRHRAFVTLTALAKSPVGAIHESPLHAIRPVLFLAT